MFAPTLGRRATAVATALAVVVGLAITPAAAYAATEGLEPVAAPPAAQPPAAQPPVAEPPAVEPPAAAPPAADPPVADAPAPAVQQPAPQPAAPPAPAAPDAQPSSSAPSAPAPSLARDSGPAAPQPMMAARTAGIAPATIGTQVIGQPVNIQFSTNVDHDRWVSSYSLWPFGSKPGVSSSGLLSGSFSQTGEHTLTVEAQERVSYRFLGQTLWRWDTVDTKTYEFYVIPAVTTATLPDATVGVNYTQTLEATRGSLVNRFDVSEGELPRGLSLGRFSGTISGTVRSIPASPTTYNFSVVLTANGVASAPQPLSITVGYPAPVVTTTTVPDATVGSAYAGAQLTATGSGTITWSASGLPAGLQLDAATGAISGTPTYVSGYEASTPVTFEVTANNGRDSAAQTVSLTVVTPPPAFHGPTKLPAGTVGVAYDYQLPVSNNYGELSFTLTGGALPSGLALTAAGRMVGTPDYDATAGASSTFTVRARVTGAAGYDTKRFTITVHTPAPSVVTETLPDGWLNQRYDEQIITTGPGVQVSVENLPRNLTFDGTRITGTPRVAGSIDLKVTAINTAGETVRWVALNINDKPNLRRMAVAKVQTGDTFSSQPRVDGVDVELRLGNNVPDGMTMSEGGLIEWTPSAPGVYKYTVHASNPAGSVKRTYTIKVFDAPVITQDALDHGYLNVAYRQAIQHDGTAVKFSIARGDLPQGLTLTKKGVIKGIPTETGTFTVTVKAKNAVGVDRQQFTITVTEPAMQLSAPSITRGNTVTVTGSGFMPGSSQEIWLHSTPVLLDTVVATDGTFAATVRIPLGTAAGAHQIEVRDAQSGSHFTDLTVSDPVVPATPTTPAANTPAVNTPQPNQPSTLRLITSDQTPATPETVEAVELAGPELPTLSEPTQSAPTAEVPANADSQNWFGLLMGSFALLLAVLTILLLMWRRRRQADAS